MSFRKEEKFRLSLSDSKSLKFDLLNKGMKPLFPKRMINSIYFDTSDMSLFLASEEGVLPRKKIRVRWYDSETIYKLEIKFSTFEGRFKTSKNFEDRSFKKNFHYQMHDPDIGIVKPIVHISYHREYYSYKGVRLTFDSNISYKGLGSLRNSKAIDEEMAMEIKANINTPDDYIKTILPNPTARFSKFSRGILRLREDM